MSPMRIAGLIMIAFGILFGAVDIFNSAADLGGQITVLSIWTKLSLRSMNFVEMVIQNYVWAPIWNNGVAPILLLPAWMFFMICGVLAFFLGRRRIE